MIDIARHYNQFCNDGSELNNPLRIVIAAKTIPPGVGAGGGGPTPLSVKVYLQLSSSIFYFPPSSYGGTNNPSSLSAEINRKCRVLLIVVYSFPSLRHSVEIEGGVGSAACLANYSYAARSDATPSFNPESIP